MAKGDKRKKAAPATASASTAAPMRKKTGDWARSDIAVSKVDGYRRDGLLPPEDVLPTRIPGDEVTPQPKEHERVCFHDFVVRGLSFPIHDFLRALMYAYKVQLHDFSPNSLLHVAVFVVLCECFLGVHPHWGLWKKIFNVRRNAGAGGVYTVGGLIIQARKEVSYFDIRQVDSAQNWRKKWFYFTSQQEGLPDFVEHSPLVKTRAWLHQTSAAEEAEAKPLMEKIEKLLKTTGRVVSGLHLISTFIKRDVQPLRARVHPMWEFQGVQDPTRLTTEPLPSKKAVEDRVRAITKLTKNDLCPLDCPVDPYDSEHPLPEVCILLLPNLLCLYSCAVTRKVSLCDVHVGSPLLC